MRVDLINYWKVIAFLSMIRGFYATHLCKEILDNFILPRWQVVYKFEF
jgi:hypothetical protein